MKNIVIYMIQDFELRCGGAVVQYELAKRISDLNYTIQMITPNNVNNHICNNFLINKTIDPENTIVIYGEGITNNPLNAKYVVRWILAPLGLCCPPDIHKTWDPTDLVYYFNSEDKFSKHPEKVGNIYKLLNILYVNPSAKNNNPGPRSGCCHTFRKSHYHKNLVLIHPPHSRELTTDLTQDQLIEQFNKFQYFISYDPLTFISVIAALCGCVSIVKKVDGMSKAEWLNNTSCSEYIKAKGINTLYGIAYGADDLENAISTMHLVKEQWDDIVHFMTTKNIKSFISDMENYETLINTVQNNY